MPTATWQASAALSNEALDAPPMPTNAASAEAARYAVLRRMGSAIRHQVAGALQPVGMLASMLERRVQAAQPNMDALRKNCSEMSGLARSASAECVALMGWLAPPNEGELVPLGEVVDECVHLLATELSFRGFTVSTALQARETPVPRTALRNVLPACLMALTDGASAAGEVRLQSSVEPAGGLRVSLTFIVGADTQQPARAKAYRPLIWRDVQALAADEGIDLTIEQERVDLRLPGPQ
jgi:hypothetical protein